MEEDTSTTDATLSPQDEAEGDVKHDGIEEVVAAESSVPGPLKREHVTKRLSVLGRNPFTQAHIYTTATLTGLHLSDVEAIREFPHIQVREPSLDHNELLWSLIDPLTFFSSPHFAVRSTWCATKTSSSRWRRCKISGCF